MAWFLAIFLIFSSHKSLYEAWDPRTEVFYLFYRECVPSVTRGDRAFAVTALDRPARGNEANRIKIILKHSFIWELVLVLLELSLYFFYLILLVLTFYIRFYSVPHFVWCILFKAVTNDLGFLLLNLNFIYLFSINWLITSSMKCQKTKKCPAQFLQSLQMSCFKSTAGYIQFTVT